MTKMENDFNGTELAVRCHICGDSSKHPTKAHGSVNVITGLFYCYRCQTGTKLSPVEMEFITKNLKFDRARLVKSQDYTREDIISAIESQLQSGPGIARYSALDRYHLQLGDTKWDVFKIVDPSHEVYGYHLRHPTDKSQSRTYGKRLLGMSSKIRHSRIWRIVEGAYDCLDPHSDICVFGLPSEMQANLLYGKELIICPDGDIWGDYRKLRQFMKSFIWNMNIRIKYVERLPPNKDPDEVMPNQRERLSPNTVKQMLTPKRTFFVNRMSAEQILEEIQKTHDRTTPEEEWWSGYTKNQTNHPKEYPLRIT